MAKTLKLNVSFPMSIVIKAETIADLQKIRKDSLEIPAEKLAKLNGEARFKVGLFTGDKTDEQILEIIFRSGIRTFLREDLRKELEGDESRIRVGDVKVVYEDQSVLARACSCGACFECRIARGGSDE
jgi:hypothetical protein